MRLLLHRTLSTVPLVEAVTADVDPALQVESRATLSGAEVGENDAALIESSELAHLVASHLVVPEIAVVLGQGGPVAMRTPARPDEIEQSAVVLYECGGNAELLARATIEPYFGIKPAAWVREPDPDARVSVVDGYNALRETESGFSEDLCRAWFILTGEPVVSHVLVVPRSTGDADARAAIDVVTRSRVETNNRRRELYPAVAAREGVDVNRMRDLFGTLRWAIEDTDRRALLMLLQRGNRGSAYPYVWEIGYRDVVSSAT